MGSHLLAPTVYSYSMKKWLPITDLYYHGIQQYETYNIDRCTKRSEGGQNCSLPSKIFTKSCQ
jgi:hypothetical protein